MARQVRPEGDDPLSKVAKLIPAEVSAAFLAVNNLIGNDPKWDDWRVRGPILFLWIMCPLLLRYVQKVQSPVQICITTLLFPIWVANIAPDRFGFEGTNPAIILILSTLLLPFLPASSNRNGGPGDQAP